MSRRRCCPARRPAKGLPVALVLKFQLRLFFHTRCVLIFLWFLLISFKIWSAFIKYGCFRDVCPSVALDSSRASAVTARTSGRSAASRTSCCPGRYHFKAVMSIKHSRRSPRWTMNSQQASLRTAVSVDCTSRHSERALFPNQTPSFLGSG